MDRENTTLTGLHWQQLAKLKIRVQPSPALRLQWSQQIKLISSNMSKANRMLGLIRRVCREITDPDTKKLLYCLLVRLQLGYACELWSPYTSKDKLLLENVQRTATKFILNYPRDMSYRDRKLSLLPLEYRREMKDLLVLIYNARAAESRP